MAKKENFSFKKIKHIGRWKSFEPETHDIKLGGLKIGYIQVQRTFARSHPDDGMHKIHFYVKDENITKRNITLKISFNSSIDAKNFILRNVEKLKTKFDFYKCPKEKIYEN
ncbi:MAG TPA: hypothetical protein VI815_02660 [Candidatus Nanoarchaeia archaeon]|nr:hypothetical protein [Candidatus Nanoarchaeia archaeon]